MELLGLPGVGKSTLAERLSRELGERGYRCMERGEQQAELSALHRQRAAARRWAGFVGWAAAQRPGWVAQAVAFAAHLKPHDARGWRRLWSLARNLHNAELHAPHLACRQQAIDVLLLDQDLVQEVWSVLYLRQAFDEGRAARLMAAMRPQLADLVVVLELPAQACLARMKERRAHGGPVGEIDAMADLHQETLEASGRALLRLADVLASHGLAQVVRLDARQSPEAMCAVLVPVIAEALGGAR